MRTAAELSEEERRVASLIRSVDQSLADPHISLVEAMRLANWLRQLEGYLEGIRFALGEKVVSYVPEGPAVEKTHERNQ